MINNHRITSFQTRLLTGAVLVVLLVGALLFISNSIIQDASERLSQIQEEQIQPLAEINKLQAKVDQVRVIEIYLPLLKDYFALAAEVDRFNRAIIEFDSRLELFSQQYQQTYPSEIKRFQTGWERLQENLQAVSQAASLSDVDEAQRISTYESSPRFASLSKNLQSLAEKIEKGSKAAYFQGVDSLERKRKQFLSVSVISVVVGLLLLLYFARSLSKRIADLREAFQLIADGDMTRDLPIRGNDELTELAQAFGVMKEKVSSRELALKKSREVLEERVLQRTKALRESNLALTDEIAVRRKVEQDLLLLSKAVNQSPVSVIITDNKGRIQYVNRAFEINTGYSFQEVRDQNPRIFSSGTTPDSLYKQLWETIQAGDEWQGEICNRKKNGDLHWEYTHISPVKSDEKVITHFLAIKQDIDERKAQEEKIRYQAQYDALTDLPNRTLAMDRLTQVVHQARRDGNKAVLMFIDLDGFKHINDSLGHDVGDVLLVQAAQRLRRSVREVDTVARQGGDEFLVIMGGLNSREDVMPVLENLLKAFSVPFKISGNDLVVTPSIGLALYPDDGEDGQVLLRNADMAMYQAKDLGRNTYFFYNHLIHEHLSQRMELESYLRHAIDRDELSLAYQPILATDSDQLTGIEALLRWRNDALGDVTPDTFIPLAEQTGLIIEIGNWVLREACQQMADWHQQGFNDLYISLNLSPRQIQREDFHQTILDVLQSSGLDPSLLILEMTEGMLIRNPSDAKRMLSRLKGLGVQLAMDDFGTGYSSLSNLKNYPFDMLKIDRSFIFDIDDDPSDLALVGAAVSMGKGLGLITVAEGVEKVEQQKLLVEMGCDRVQGDLHSKPLKAAQMSQWLQRSR
ncbi:MAG: EAL domain-containing protein [Motiliproteus sp.]|nr:EAL domain-containing protein [Motiliproteus sp.]MCW9052454.1 EAL domain-containing protein [Motiliproteus sp.]